NTVVMGTQYTTVYQQVIEKTRALSFRTSLLSSNIEKREQELANRRSGATEGQDRQGGRGGRRGGRGGGRGGGRTGDRGDRDRAPKAERVNPTDMDE
ncbi:hypothetical protein HDU96_003907, partial [Phlyctochytrium bullatum]